MRVTKGTNKIHLGRLINMEKLQNMAQDRTSSHNMGTQAGVMTVIFSYITVLLYFR